MVKEKEQTSPALSFAPAVLHDLGNSSAFTQSVVSILALCFAGCVSGDLASCIHPEMCERLSQHWGDSRVCAGG